jgi:hypothetical protein
MSQRLLAPLLAVGLVFLGGWLLAQPAGPARDQPEGTPGHFAVAPAGDSAVLLETKSGRAWLLRQSADGIHTVWLPTERLERPDQAQQWLQRENELQGDVERQRRRLLDERSRGEPKK